MTIRKIPLACLTIVAGIFACSTPDITSPDQFARQPSSGTVQAANLLECPTTQSSTATSLITPLGGIVSAGGVSVSIPAGALLNDAQVTLTVPASNYLEIDVTVAGSEHFIFELPVTITLSYARCNRADIGLQLLSAWYIDSVTKEPLQQMPSVDNKLTKTVTFTTGHFSGYAIAN